jgi:hypothetical protein
MRQTILFVAALLVAASPATAMVRLFTASAANGGGPGEVLIARWTIAIPPEERITAARFTSQFGNTAAPASAIGTLTVGGIVVAECAGAGFSCWEGPVTPIAYDFSAADFGALTGLVDFVYDQTDCCDIRLGDTQLAITTEAAAAPIPEPDGWMTMIIGLGLVGLVKRRRAGFAVSNNETWLDRLCHRHGPAHQSATCAEAP